MDIISVLVLFAILSLFGEGETMDFIMNLLFKIILYGIMFLFMTFILLSV